ncbi:MAG: hypothetical protein K0S33_3717 [Bacteroidetes bacterium]|jgi:hypothetical protein|nr:hypothetical protein [Bacteroidota bacterium]
MSNLLKYLFGLGEPTKNCILFISANEKDSLKTVSMIVQWRILRKFCHLKNINMLKRYEVVFKEDSISRQFQNMYSDLMNDELKAEFILVTNRKRLGLSEPELAVIIKDLAEKNIHIVEVWHLLVFVTHRILRNNAQ